MVYTKKIHHLIPLGFILTATALLKLPSLFEPNHYGDEGIYQVIGQALRRGELLYRDIWDNKPPLLYLIYAFLDGNQFLIRLASLIFSLATVAVFYFLAQEIFRKQKTPLFLTTILFAILFSLPLLEGNIANAENFMLLPIILAFYLVFRALPQIKTSILLASGALLSLAFLLKIVAVFDLAALIIFLMIIFWGKTNQQFKILSLISVGFTLLIIATGLSFLYQGAFKEFLSATFSQNVSYVAWGNKFLVAQGFLIFKLFLLSFFCFFLFWKRKQLEKGQLLVFLWWAFSLFNAFFAQRPWTHYLLVLVPSVCLLLGTFFQTAKFRVLTAIIILLTLYLALTKFWIYGKTPVYYLNFFSFFAQNKTLDQYYSFWGGHVNRDYRVAQFLAAKTSPEEPVFIWGNNPQIYALAERLPASRYTVSYHMSFTPRAEEETLNSILTRKPRYFIILLPPTDPLGNLQKLLMANYRLTFEEEGFSVYEKRF